LATVQYLLASCTLIGEYQPGHMANGERHPDGDAVRGYDPALVTEKELYQLQPVCNARRVGRRGRRGKNVASIFGRVLVSGHDGGTMTLCPFHLRFRQFVFLHLVSFCGAYLPAAMSNSSCRFRSAWHTD
jgi:hypothetical protein